jgi:hypothetical protein
LGAFGGGEMIARVLYSLLLALVAATDLQAKSLSEAEQAGCEATIQIVCKEKKGSGVVIATIKDSGTNGSITFALTANHVIAGANEIDITAIVSGTAKTFKNAQIVWQDEGRPDLALLSFFSGNDKIRAAILGKREKYQEDFPIFKTSWKDGRRPIFRDDQAIKRVLVTPNQPGPHPANSTAFFWQTKGTSERGESGGGMFNEDGMLLGICSANQLNVNQQTDVGYFTHRDEIYFALKKFVKSPGGAALKPALPWLESNGPDN